MYILGISSFSHESSCSLIKDGEVKCVMEEERFNREKHTWKFPANAIDQALAFEGITFDQIDHVTFFWDPKLEIRGNLRHFLKYFPKTLNLLKAKSETQGLTFTSRINSMKNLDQHLKDHFKLSYKPKVHYISHHLAHAASSFFISGYEKAAILTVDGRGESTSTMMAVGDGNKIKKIKEIKVPHSLGHLYAAITSYLGFMPFFDEWKVMGMSAYGRDTYKNVFEDMVVFEADGGYKLNLKYFNFHTHGQSNWVSDYLINQLGPVRKKDQAYDQRHYDIAYGLQKIVEKTGVYLARHLYASTKLPSLCLTGGVALNCLMNKKILEETDFKNVFIQPIANDAGTSLGSALYYYHQVLGKKRNYIFKSPYLGVEFSNDQIENVLKKSGVSYWPTDHVAQETAQFIMDNKIVGWYQGRMEAGPRALGHRSIVVNPSDPDMKDRLNHRVKRREHFRPFAPSVLEEKVDEFFLMPKQNLSPYMILIADVKEDKRQTLPAITHADGTARVHTVNKDVSPKYYQLISEFEKLSGVGVLLNTSFNENEPIVCTPQEAVNCFLRTDFDVLAIGDFIATKENV